MAILAERKDMKYVSLFAAILLSTGLVLAACSGDSDSSLSSDNSTTETEIGGPRIYFDTEYVSLGEATPDEQMTHIFALQNTGDAPLIIDEVKKKTLEGC